MMTASLDTRTGAASLDARSLAIESVVTTGALHPDPEPQRVAPIANVPREREARPFAEELESVVPAAFGYALRLTRNRADAEDLVQEAALHACRGRDGFEPGTNFKAWFFRILTTTFWGRHRRDRRRPSTVDFDDAPVLQLYARSAEYGLPMAGENPAADLIDRLGTERVAAALGALPEEFQVVCSLYFMEDFAYHEIADVLGVPVGTVRSRLHRGRKMLQKSLWLVAIDAGIVSDESGR